MLLTTVVGSALVVAALIAIGARLYPAAVGAFGPVQDLGMRYGRGRWAVVTGASGGVGSALVSRLLEQGLRVVAASLPDEHFSAPFLAEREEDSSVLRRVAVDLRDAAGAAEALDRATAALDVAIVFSNAGTAGAVAPFESLASTHAVAQFVALNAASHAAVAQRFYRRMVASGRRGAIVFTSSAMAQLPASHAELYCSAKAFVERLALALSPAARAHGVDVLCVLPGALRGTRFLDDQQVSRCGVLRAVYAIAQSPAAAMDAMFRCVGRRGIVTVDCGVLAVLSSLADALLSPNLFSALFGWIVFGSRLLRPLFADYANLPAT